MIGIYKITSPIGKIYIGQSINIEKRFDYYIKLKCKNQIKLYNSLLKYGAKNHIFEIIEECKIIELNNRERYWQEYYNVLLKNGLNCQYVNNTFSNRIFSETTKIKMSISAKKKTFTTTQIDSFHRNKKGENNTMYGKVQSNDAKLKISIKAKKRILENGHPKGNLGKQMSIETKEKIKNKRLLNQSINSKKIINIKSGIIYNSIGEAAKENNINRATLCDYLYGRIKINKSGLAFFCESIEDFQSVVLTFGKNKSMKTTK